MAPEVDLSAIEPEIDLFSRIRADVTLSVIKRAEEKAIEAGERQSRQLHGRAFARSDYADVLKSASAMLDQLSWGPRPSIRITAPDTGGRTFHVGYSFMTRGTRKQKENVVASDNQPVSAHPATDAVLTKKHPRRKLAARCAESAHQRYVEREPALAGMSFDNSANLALQEHEPPIVSDKNLSIEAAAQKYVENSTKTVFGNKASFGTIGENFFERVDFWNLVHDHESPHGGRTQSRLVVELPHEASHDQMHEIIREFTNLTFRRRGVPFWVGIHAPTKENDSRNFHAHIVFTERPMRQIVDPATGRLAWDFTIRETYKTSSRHTKVHYPHRQNRCPELREKYWIKQVRADFAQITNRIVCKKGEKDIYDPRSYKDMGLDITPMKSIKRITADKVKSGRLVVADADRHRALIDRELRQTAICRKHALVKQTEVEAQIRDAAMSANHPNARKPLPSHLKLNRDANSRRGSQYGKTVIEKFIHTERARQAVMHENDLAKMALEDIVRVTAPRSISQNGSTVYPPDVTFDVEAMNDLHVAATEELAELGIKSQSQRDAFAGTFRVLGLAWNPGIYRQFHPYNVLRLPVPFAQGVTKSLLRLYDSFVDHNDRPIDFMFQNFMDEAAERVREREVERWLAYFGQSAK
jgi:hypothetical protein